MLLTATPSERIGRCTRMRRFFVRFNKSESFVHTRSSVGFTIITSGFEFSVHTALSSLVPDRGRSGSRPSHAYPARLPHRRNGHPRHLPEPTSPLGQGAAVHQSSRRGASATSRRRRG